MNKEEIPNTSEARHPTAIQPYQDAALFNHKAFREKTHKQIPRVKINQIKLNGQELQIFKQLSKGETAFLFRT